MEITINFIIITGANKGWRSNYIKQYVVLCNMLHTKRHFFVIFGNLMRL